MGQSHHSVRTPLRLALVSVHGDPLLPTGSEEAGGQNVYVREVARKLAERGHQVDVFTRGRECREAEIHTVGHHRVIRLPTGPVGFISRDHLFEHLPEFVWRVREFARAQGQRYDLVHSNYWLSGWVGMRLSEAWRVPQAHTHHSLGAVKFAAQGAVPPAGLARLEVERALLGRSSIVATSPQDVASMRRYYLDPDDVTVIPCGIDEGVFHPHRPEFSRRELGLPVNGKVLAYAGRFDVNKGIDCLVEAGARLQPDVHLAIAGGFDPAARDGDEYRRIAAMVQAHGLSERTTFLGKLEPERLALLYAAADLCVVPSHYESFGLVAIESMGCGTPVVASRVGGLQYTVRHQETGWLFPARDSEALAIACERLLADEAARRRMGAAALEHVRRSFTWTRVAERLEQLYLARIAPPLMAGAL